MKNRVKDKNLPAGIQGFLKFFVEGILQIEV
jgi:hypothetical protein